MGLPVKNLYNDRKTVSKKEFEKSYMELMERVRLIDQKLSTKADDIVFTMALKHRKEIDALQEEIVKLREELKQKQQTTLQKQLNTFTSRKRDRSRIFHWFKSMQIIRK